MNKYTLVALSVTGGILSGLAWTGWCTGLILLIAFVPFFLIENYLFENQKKFSLNACFIYFLPGFVIFSIIALGWMRVASITGAICVIMGLSFLMAFTMWLAHIVRVKAGNITGFISILTFWLGYEFITLNMNLISPWLDLGNGLSKDIFFIQWYEVTGTAGGSLWILVSNLFLTLFLVNSPVRKQRTRLFLWIWLSVIIIPSIISITRYYTIDQNKRVVSEVAIIQPNSDPYTEKFTIPFEEQLKKVIGMASASATDKTDWIITPETTVDDPVNLDDLNNNKYIRMIKELTERYPNASVVTGLVSYRVYPSFAEAPTLSARETDISGSWYDHFNSAFKIDTGKTIEVYHKSKLVPGIEMQFSNGPGRFISKILPFLGGTKWGYGIQKERTCFQHKDTGQKIAPVICYESVFGEYVTFYIKKGAGAIFVITNDGWWKNTNGYKQHLSFASLRAIETRRPVARAANTGISGIIDIRGAITSESEWWTQTTLRGEIYPETRITIYVKYGDYLMRISSIISVLILIFIFIIIPIRKKSLRFEKTVQP
ncbi:MAG: apolipoprotein N-acyltransferase [Bacteroidetes bacterium]|nr:MAG: apolipoprotein N-acyltransferase [Bacteroidota bacterium]